jgi:uncharacterized Zn-finger protein
MFNLQGFSKQTLKHHIAAVHGKKTRFNCTHCPKAFYFKHDLRNHIASHMFTNDDTTNSNRPFECDKDNCGKFFKTKKELKGHQLHSGEKVNLKQLKILIPTSRRSFISVPLRKSFQVEI